MRGIFQKIVFFLIVLLMASCADPSSTNQDLPRVETENTQENTTENQDDANLGPSSSSSSSSQVETLDSSATGIFFWKQEGNRLDSQNGILFLKQQNEILDHFNEYQINQVYGAYRKLALLAPDILIEWQKKLHSNKIQSYYLMGENTWVCDSAGLFSRIQERFIQFNQLNPQYAFHGLILDIEPHALRSESVCQGFNWKEATLEEKQNKLQNLLKVYQDVRTLLVEAQQDIPVIAVLPYWFDNYYPKNQGSFYWNNAQEMTQFFTGLAQSVDAMTLMSFCRHDLASIKKSFQGETQILQKQIRVTLNADESECDPWKNIEDYFELSDQLHGLEELLGVDYQSYSHLNEL